MATERVDWEALKDIGHATTGRTVAIDLDTYRAIIADLKRAKRLETAARDLYVFYGEDADVILGPELRAALRLVGPEATDA